MPGHKKRKVSKEAHSFFQLSVNSDGTATVLLSPRFNAFPEQLMSTITRQIEQQHAFSSFVRDNAPVHIASYDIWNSRWVWPRSTAPETNHKATYSIAGQANLIALDRFSTDNLRNRDVADATWVDLSPLMPGCNAHFDKLHTLGTDGIGWGFDHNGCVVLYVVKKEAACVRMVSTYVQRVVQIPQHTCRLKENISNAGTVRDGSDTEAED